MTAFESFVVCSESYTEDLSGGDWIQCICCKDWEARCKGDITSFTCLNCHSDDEYE